MESPTVVLLIDLGYMMNYAMFIRNNRLGYVLKPAALRLKDKQMTSKHTKHFLDVTVGSVFIDSLVRI